MRGPKTSLKTISLKSPPGRGQDARAHMSAGTGSGSQMFCLKDFAPSFEARMNSVVGIHTHPVGERVSSADLVTAIKLHPEMNRQNKRRLSMVIAPKGIYIYKPTHHIIELYKGPYR